MKWISILASMFLVITLTAMNPNILAKNKFIDGLASHEIIAILVVILTVTMASVANIHLAIGRLRENLLRRKVDVSGLVAEARRELSENAWALFGLFCVCIVVLAIKGHIGDDNVFWLSVCHSAIIVILVVNLAILYDIYRSVYELTSLDGPAVHNGQSDDGSSPMN